jgi:hypothetical protein
MSRWIMLPVFILSACLCMAQKNELYDSALVSNKIDKIVGTWYYSNKKRDTFIVRIDKIPMQVLYPGTDFTQHTTIVWVYYKKADTVKESGLFTYAPDKYSTKNWTFTGTYLDYMKAVVLSYFDKKLNEICQVKITPKNKRKIIWRIKYTDEKDSKKGNFFYPEKLILRRMKKNLL